MIRRTKLVLASAALALTLTACGSSEPGPDLRFVLSRTTQAMSIFDKYLKEKKIEKATDQHMAQFNGFLQKAMNVKPPVYKIPIATKLLKDAKFEGYGDANGNGVVDSGEKRLFTVEVDLANKRLIATDTSGQSTSRGVSGLGFLAGALIGNLLGRQRASGVTPQSFSNRKVTPPSAYGRARSRARSGGMFRGK